jgi:hypothetical protein
MSLLLHKLLDLAMTLSHGKKGCSMHLKGKTPSQPPALCNTRNAVYLLKETVQLWNAIMHLQQVILLQGRSPFIMLPTMALSTWYVYMYSGVAVVGSMYAYLVLTLPSFKTKSSWGQPPPRRQNPVFYSNASSVPAFMPCVPQLSAALIT